MGQKCVGETGLEGQHTDGCKVIKVHLKTLSCPAGGMSGWKEDALVTPLDMTQHVHHPREICYEYENFLAH